MNGPERTLVFRQVLRKPRAHFSIVQYTVLYDTRNHSSCTGKETNQGLLFFGESTIKQEQKLVKACAPVEADFSAALSPWWKKSPWSLWSLFNVGSSQLWQFQFVAVHVAFVANNKRVLKENIWLPKWIIMVVLEFQKNVINISLPITNWRLQTWTPTAKDRQPRLLQQLNHNGGQSTRGTGFLSYRKSVLTPAYTTRSMQITRTIKQGWVSLTQLRVNFIMTVACSKPLDSTDSTLAPSFP